MALLVAPQLSGDSPFSGGRINMHSEEESCETESGEPRERDMEGWTDSAV